MGVLGHARQPVYLATCVPTCLSVRGGVRTWVRASDVPVSVRASVRTCAYPRARERADVRADVLAWPCVCSRPLHAGSEARPAQPLGCRLPATLSPCLRLPSLPSLASRWERISVAARNQVPQRFGLCSPSLCQEGRADGKGTRLDFHSGESPGERERACAPQVPGRAGRAVWAERQLGDLEALGGACTEPFPAAPGFDLCATHVAINTKSRILKSSV